MPAASAGFLLYSHPKFDTQGHGFGFEAEGAKNSALDQGYDILQATPPWSSTRHSTMPSQAFGSPKSTSIEVNNYTKHEKHIQQILAATFASTSVLAGLVAIYWFARMKRNFRHQYALNCSRPHVVRSPGPANAELASSCYSLQVTCSKRSGISSQQS